MKLIPALLMYPIIAWEFILSTKQSLESDTFLYVVGTIIANVDFLTLKKSGNTFFHLLKL